MHLGVIGLGRTGTSIVRRLLRDGHESGVRDVDGDAVAQLESDGATGAGSFADLAAGLDRPRIASIMVLAASRLIILSELKAPFGAARVAAGGAS